GVPGALDVPQRTPCESRAVRSRGLQRCTRALRGAAPRPAARPAERGDALRLSPPRGGRRWVVRSLRNCAQSRRWLRDEPTPPWPTHLPALGSTLGDAHRECSGAETAVRVLIHSRDDAPMTP